MYQFFPNLEPTSGQTDLEIRFYPANDVYIYENTGEGAPQSLVTLVIQNITAINHGDQKLQLEAALIMAEKQGQVIQTNLIQQDTLQKAAEKLHAYQKQGILEFFDFQFQTSRYLQGVGIASNATLEAGEAVVITHRAMLLQEIPDRVRVLMRARSATGEVIIAQDELQVVDYRSPVDYHFPLDGRWLIAASASLHSHHRWGIIQEFAMDMVKLGEGGLTHNGHGTKLSDFYAYGCPVYAAADGVVVTAIDGHEESDTNLKQLDESGEAYTTRMMTLQQQLLTQGLEYICGNHVIIEHENQECSFYIHLKHNSLKVKSGDKVVGGQQIGELGHSGNSTEPHLHFHVALGSDLNYARSIPVTFSDVMPYPAGDKLIRHLQSGQLVIAQK